MNTPTDTANLAALRRRFLMENPNTIADWLLAEHPQTAAFVLSWIGDINLMQVFLESLPPIQQADLLCRICYLNSDRPLDSFQADLLIEALHTLTPGPRSVDITGEDEEETNPSGLRLVQEYFNELEEAEFETLILELEELDRNLARLCHNRYVTLHDTDHEERRRNIYAVLNLLCDFIGYLFNRSLSAGTSVYVESVELQSDLSFIGELDAESTGFKVTDGSGRVVVFIQFSPRLLYHYLEMSYGASRPFLHSNFEKAAFTPLEAHAAQIFANELSEALMQAVDAHHEEGQLTVSSLQGNALGEEVAGLGEETVIKARLAVKVAKSTVGTLQLVFPASQLNAEGDTEEGFFSNFQAFPAVQEELSPPKESPSPAAEEADTSPREEIPEDSLDVEPLDLNDEALLDENLEDLLFQSTLEDADLAQEVETAASVNPLDMLLQGYSTEDAKEVMPESMAEQERMAALHYHYGSTLFQKEIFSEAAEALSQVLIFDSEHSHARLLQAAAWGEQGLYLKEILTYKGLVADENCLPEALVLLARRLSFLGKVDESLKTLKKAIQMGFNGIEIIESDPCFLPLRNSTRWRQFNFHNS